MLGSRENGVTTESFSTVKQGEAMANLCFQEILASLHRGERSALRKFSRCAGRFEAPSKWSRTGVASLDTLVVKGLLIEGETGIYGRTFRLSELGEEVVDRLEAAEVQE